MLCDESHMPTEGGFHRRVDDMRAALTARRTLHTMEEPLLMAAFRAQDAGAARRVDARGFCAAWQALGVVVTGAEAAGFFAPGGVA